MQNKAKAKQIIFITMKTSCWEIVTAIATALAVVLVLWKDWIWAYRKRPKLKLEYEDKPLFRVDKEDYLYLRFLVTNTGKSTILNCHCQILSLVYNGIECKGGQRISLRWANQLVENTKDTWVERLYLARGEGKYVDLALMKKSDKTNKTKEIPYIHGKQRDFPLSNGAYETIIYVYGDNIEPKELRLCITTTDDDITAKIIQ
jgi:hypothetical protein